MVVPIDLITTLDPNSDSPPDPLFVIVLLTTLILASTVLLFTSRMLPVVLLLKMLFSISIPTELSLANIVSGILDGEDWPSNLLSEQTTAEVPFIVKKIPLALFKN